MLKYSGTNDQGCKFPADGLVSVAVVRKRTKWRLFVAYSRVAGKLDVSNGAPPTSVVPRLLPFGKSTSQWLPLHCSHSLSLWNFSEAAIEIDD